LDVRTPGEFESEHLADSRLETLGNWDAAELARDLKGKGRCVIICHGGTRAKKAAEQLESAGLPDVQVLEGGITAWKAAGLPYIKGEREVLPLDRQVRIVVGAVVLGGVLAGHFGHPIGYAIAGFMGAGLMFAGITGWCGLAFVIGKMPWNEAGCGCNASCDIKKGAAK